MVRLILKEPYDGYPPGSLIERPGGVADVLVMRKIAEVEPVKKIDAVTFRKRKDAV